MIHALGKTSQIRDVLPQPVSKAIEHPREDDDGQEGEPQEMAVGGELAHKVVVVGHGRTHDEMAAPEVSSRIEIIYLSRRAVPLYGESLSCTQSASHLGASLVIGKFQVVLLFIIKDHPSVGSDQRHTNAFEVPAIDVSLKGRVLPSALLQHVEKEHAVANAY